jgi:hypothetical protein|tara:strand:+ start:23292 stop:25430 length:2139 start_codon:yes stop_codon:yes gene_type:complete
MGAARVRAIVAVLILIISINAGADGEDGTELFIVGDSDARGPFWIQFTCELDSCQDMELVIWADGSQYTITDSHSVEWSGLIGEEVSWELHGSLSLDAGDFVMSSIIGNPSDIVEGTDLPDLVPSPGQLGDWTSISATSTCQLNRCDHDEFLSEGASFLGVLDSSADDDAILIEGDVGDVIKISNIESSEGASIEYWSRSDSKILIGSISSDGSDRVYLDYPENAELWVRVVHSDESDFSTYRFDIVRYDDESEGPMGEELGNPWPYEFPLVGNSTKHDIYRGHISSNDQSGDSLLISSGAKIKLRVICQFTEEASLEILLHDLHGEIEQIIESSQGCPSYVNTTGSTIGVEFRINSEEVMGWDIEIIFPDEGDGVLIGDAPDLLWLETGPSEFWDVLTPGSTSYSGNLGVGDRIDIHPFEITDLNGSKVMVRSDIESPVTYQIQSLSQESWQILNYTNGSEISVPLGTHAIRVEGLSPVVGEIGYEFYIVYLGEDIPDDGEYQDLSHLFTNFYLLIGGLMLLPLAVVLWWNRSGVFKRSISQSDFDIHGLHRLDLLRERLSTSSNGLEDSPEEIVKALKMLGDSSWENVLSDLGKPSLRHMTEQIEICSWIIPESEFLVLGIRTFEYRWELSALSVSSPEGSIVSIEKVSPDHMFDNMEVFLDSMEPGTKRFLRLEIGGSPSLIELEVSGLIAGEPVAAVPREALVFGKND